MLQVQASANATSTNEVMLIDTSSLALASKFASLQIMPKPKQAPTLQTQAS